MRTSGFLTAASFTLLMLCLGCGPTFSRDEVARLSSPDGHVDAILFESNGGATTSFGYDVEVAGKGNRSGIQAATFYGAGRSDSAYGVNMNWNGNNELVLSYLSAKAPPKAEQSVDMSGKNIRISLHSGINDPNAPAGGMLYNLQKR